jgi:hypothetical protein
MRIYVESVANPRSIIQAHSLRGDVRETDETQTEIDGKTLQFAVTGIRWC